jgi:hypothetical protein
MRFEILAAVDINIILFMDVTSCGQAARYQSLWGSGYLLLQGMRICSTPKIHRNFF